MDIGLILLHIQNYTPKKKSSEIYSKNIMTCDHVCYHVTMWPVFDAYFEGQLNRPWFFFIQVPREMGRHVHRNGSSPSRVQKPCWLMIIGG
jgi:hypothetical protein